MFSYPRLGIANCTVNEFQTAATGVPVGQGNYLIEVHQNSPADLAGLRPGDVIVKIDGCPVPNYPAFVRAISRFYDQVRPVPITYLRDGITYETTADLSTDDRFTGLVDLTADSYENLKRKREYLASQRSASGQIWKKPTEDAGEPR
nr:PDZ domain-containing protein [Brevibacillus fulvus]